MFIVKNRKPAVKVLHNRQTRLVYGGELVVIIFGAVCEKSARAIQENVMNSSSLFREDCAELPDLSYGVFFSADRGTLGRCV